MAFRVRKLFGTFEKRAPGQKSQGHHEVCGIKDNLRSVGKGAERKKKNTFSLPSADFRPEKERLIAG